MAYPVTEIEYKVRCFQLKLAIGSQIIRKFTNVNSYMALTTSHTIYPLNIALLNKKMEEEE